MSMLKVLKFCILIALLALIAACAPVQYQEAYKTTYSHIVDSNSTYSDEKITLAIEPVRISYDGYKGILVRLENKSSDDVKIIWDDSYFIKNGEPTGGFMYEGITYADRNSPKQDSLIFPHSSRNITIFPTNEVLYLSKNQSATRLGLPTGWEHAVFRAGIYGAYLLITSKDYEKRVKLMFQIKEQ